MTYLSASEYRAEEEYWRMTIAILRKMTKCFGRESTLAKVMTTANRVLTAVRKDIRTAERIEREVEADFTRAILDIEREEKNGARIRTQRA